jgi:head-tail adaptor
MNAHFRAGRLDRRITIESKSETIDEFGAPVEVWTALGDFRAELLDGGATETVKQSGQVDSVEEVLKFRTRWIEGLTVADRLFYAGRAFDVIGLTEIQRRRGWEIKARHRGLS